LNNIDEKYSYSVSNKRWAIRDVDNLKTAKLVQKLNISDYLARYICSRGVDINKAELYLNPSLKEQIPSPFSILDMDKAINRIIKAFIDKETITIFGDYDVDGATASALLYRSFEEFGFNASIYIPDRIKEGYGPNISAFNSLNKKGTNLIITVDCGMTSFKEVDFAKSKNMDVIIIDHHAPEAKLPEATAVVNPNRLDDQSGLGMLAAVGVAFMLVGALKIQLISDGYISKSNAPKVSSVLDLVALGTICDVVPLIGPNRAIVEKGLRVMAQKKNLGIKALFDISEIEDFPKVFHAGFIIGPRINAGGRVGESYLGSQLLITKDENEAKNISFRLNDLNEERKMIELKVLNEARDMAEKQKELNVLVLYGKNWHVGVIGIVASRIVELFNKPTIIISDNGEESKGSGRSILGIDLGSLITSAKQLGIIKQGGGHPMACGLTIDISQVELLTTHLNNNVINKISLSEDFYWVDIPISVKGANVDILKQFKSAEPFGSGNPEPRFIIKNALIYNSKIVGENHIRCDISDTSNARINGISFRSVGTSLGKELLDNNKMHLIGKLKLSEWNGKEQVQLHIEDAISSDLAI